MLVCSGSCEEVQKCLLATGCAIIKINSGEDAIFQAQRGTFNMAVLVSTGNSMDVAETVLNLRDARPAMPIVIIVSPNLGRDEAQIIADACPNARSLTVEELAAYFSTYEFGERIAGRRSRASIHKL